MSIIFLCFSSSLKYAALPKFNDNKILLEFSADGVRVTTDAGCNQ